MVRFVSVVGVSKGTIIETEERAEKSGKNTFRIGAVVLMRYEWNA